MGLQLPIPDSVADAIRMPEEDIARKLPKEFAIALYAQRFLSFGKAREFAGMGKYEFGRLLGERGALRHYGEEELKDDLAYAG